MLLRLNAITALAILILAAGCSSSGMTISGSAKASTASAQGVATAPSRGASDPLAPGTSFRDCSDCPEMVVVPAGKFVMGSPPAEDGRRSWEDQQHPVTIAEPLAVAKFEITREEFAAFVRDSGYQASNGCWTDDISLQVAGNGWNATGFSQTLREPVVCVNWADAQAYLSWLGRKTGKPYRLLSEAEWEYAARAGTITSRYWGESVVATCNYSNVADRTAKIAHPGWTIIDCDDGAPYTSLVGRYLPNGFGLYDMIGNARELVADCWHWNYAGAPIDGSVWSGGDCTRHVMRGGDWDIRSAGTRSADRGWSQAARRFWVDGFRVCVIVSIPVAQNTGL